MNPKTFALLSDRGSLTGRFEQAMGVKPTLTRLKQAREYVLPEERRVLDIKFRQVALVREIKMGTSTENWLFARTIVPMRTLQGNARRISMLNEAPIGKILFGRNGAIRSQMTVEKTRDLPESISQLNMQIDSPLWLRRSIFEFEYGPLMVCEVFLPDCPIYNNKNCQ